MEVTRESLYAQVWARPTRDVAAQYKISDVYLGRVCDRLNVPRPPRGYWAKQASGVAVKQPPLPVARPDHDAVWRLGSLPRLPDSPRQLLRRDQLHPLLPRTLDLFENGWPSHHGYLRPKKRELADLFVSKTALKRARDLTSELYHSLEEKGYRVDFAKGESFRPDLVVSEASKSSPDQMDVYQTNSQDKWTPSRPTVVQVDSVSIGLTVFELSESRLCRLVGGNWVPYPRDRKPKPSTDGAFRRSGTYEHMTDIPSGRLCVRAYSAYRGVKWERQWRETETEKLPTFFPAIIAALEQEAPKLVARKLEADQRSRREHEERQRQWAEEDRQRREQLRLESIDESREELLAVVQQWSLARGVEEFFAELQASADSLAIKERDALLKRIDKARSLLGGAEALSHFQDWIEPGDAPRHTKRWHSSSDSYQKSPTPWWFWKNRS